MSYQFPNRRSFAAAGGICCLSLLSLTAEAADDSLGNPFSLVSLSIATAPTPDITEDSKGPSGATTSYDWQGVRSSGVEIALGIREGRDHACGSGCEWGAELAFANYNITPQSYKVAGVTYANNSGSSLYYRTLGVNAFGGWLWGTPNGDDFHGFVEVAPVLGVGLVYVNSEARVPVGTYTKDHGFGAYYQYGLRLGGYITEERWVYGVNVAYIGGKAFAKVDFSGGYSSKMTLDTSGFSIGAVAAYRF